MKKIYSLLIALVAMTFSVAAQDMITLKVNVDNAAAYTMEYGDWENRTPVDVVDGWNTYSIPEGNSLYIKANEGYMFLKLYNGVYQYDTIPSDNEASIYAGSSYNNGEFFVYSCLMSEFRTAKFTLIVDKAEDLAFNCPAFGYYPEIVDGSNTIYFNTEAETSWSFSHADYSKALFELKINGEAQDSKGTGSFYIDVKDGDVIEVTTAFPDIDVPVNFVFVNEGTEGVIEEVSVNYATQDLEQVLSGNFTVKAGDNLLVYFKNQTYNIKSVKVNDADYQVYGSLQLLLTAATTITVEAEAYAEFEKTIIVEGAEYLTFAKGYWDRTPVTLVNGENKLTFSEADADLFVIPNTGIKLTKLEDNGEDLLPGYSTYNNNIEVSKDGICYITAEPIVYNSHFALYLDFNPKEDPESYSKKYYFSMYDYARNTFGDAQGYNVYGFDPDESGEFAISWYESPFYNCYLNDVKYAPAADYSSSYFEFPELTDGDVIKCFLESDPAHVQLTIEHDGLADFTATRDHVKAHTTFGEAINVLPGTHVKLDAADGEILVAANGVEGTAAASHEFVITENTKLTVKVATGIENITAEAAAADDAIYNLQGVRVNDDNLPAGIYIRGGKKVFVK